MKNDLILKKNDIYTARIEGYTSEALGVCRIGGRAVFVKGALAGETWEIRIVKVGSSAIYGRGERLIEPSDERREPDCPYFRACGGCDTRHMSYEAELDFKLGKVNDALERIGKQPLKAAEIIGADKTAHYRNKGIMAVADINGRACAGFFRERSHDIIGIDDCLIQDKLCAAAAKAVTGFLDGNGIAAYSEQTGKGSVRHVYTRRACHTADAVLCIVSAHGFGALTPKLVDTVRTACPELTGIVLNINKSRGNTVLDGDFYTLWGRENITDTLCDVRFDISPRAFFQVNPPQAEKLYEKALEYAGAGMDDTVLDLYCGAGTISLCLAKNAGLVIGAEIVPQAIENAKGNAESNGIENAEFICADAGEAACELKKRGIEPKIIVVDPPRKGMDAQAVEAVCSMAPERVVYVSCNPATLARDIAVFNANGYKAEKAAAVDIFPKTSHVETVCQLVLRNPVTHINFDVDVEELVQDKRGAATYGQIKDYVLEHSGLKVSSLYIAQVKQKCGIIERENYNKSKSEDAKQPQCPPEKEAAIMEALRYYGMIK